VAEAGVGTEYRAGREALTALLRDRSDEWPALRDQPVVACPQWSVGDTLAHLVGVCADAQAGNLEGVATDPWTAAQVDARRGCTIGELLDEWAEVGVGMEAFADAADLPQLRQWLFDGVTHELDLRGALGEPIDAGATRVGMGVRWAVDAWFASAELDGHPRPRLLLDGVPWSGGGDDVDELELRAYEAARALTGRRSLDQIRALRWRGDPEPYLAAFTWGPFTPRTEPRVEPDAV
jgi:hypothetical protein